MHVRGSPFKPFCTTEICNQSIKILGTTQSQWQQELNKSGFIATFVMDLSKAYDCFPRDLILSKLEDWVILLWLSIEMLFSKSDAKYFLVVTYQLLLDTGHCDTVRFYKIFTPEVEIEVFYAVWILFTSIFYAVYVMPGFRNLTAYVCMCCKDNTAWKLSVFSGIWTEYGEILCISSYSPNAENMEQKNSANGHFWRSMTD